MLLGGRGAADLLAHRCALGSSRLHALQLRSDPKLQVEQQRADFPQRSLQGRTRVFGHAEQPRQVCPG
jgi:hypothetical protein